MSRDIQLGSFWLEAQIGSGGMAEVWRAREASRGLPAAVKVISKTGADDPEARRQFRREVEAVARLRHPGIVTVYDYGVVPGEAADASDGELPVGRPYLAMEFAPGGELDPAEHVESWEDLRSLISEILEALAFAHARDIIHRDLKPANVLRVDDPDHPHKLSDFGIAHAVDPYENPADGAINTATFGTPHYMPPEQLRGKWREFGPWTDLYALGCMSYQLACGEVPFPDDSLFAIRRKHLESPPPELAPEFAVPPDFESWIHRLMQKDPRARYRRAADAARALEQLDAPAASETAEAGSASDGGAAPDRARTVENPSTELYAETLADGGEDAGREGDDGDLEHAETAFDRESAPGTDTGLGVAETLLGMDDEPSRPAGPAAPEAAPEMPAPPLDLPETPPRPAAGGSDSLASPRLFGLRELPLVDRRETCRRLWEALQTAIAHQSPRGVLLHGESGLGKSQLAKWFTRAADACGCATVLRADHSVFRGPTSGLARMLEVFFTVWDLDRTETYERIHGKLADVYRRAGAEPDARYLEDDARALTELVRPGREEVGTPDHDSQFTFTSLDERNVVVERLVSRLATVRPVVLQLEDVHWGPETLAFVEHLLGSDTLEEAPVAIVMTARDRILAERPEMRGRLEALGERDGVERLQLGPLDEQSHFELVRDVLQLDDALARRVHRHTSGDPLFAVQLVTEWVDHGDVEPGPDGFEPAEQTSLQVPDDPQTFWRRRLDRFLPVLRQNAGPDAEQALVLAAALGENVSSREWRHLCREAGLDDPDEVVDTLVRFGLADRREDCWSFGFGQLRDAVALRAEARGTWRRAHAACAATLEQLYGASNPEVRRRRALHLLEADEFRAALEPLLEAIERAMNLGQYNDAEYLLNRRLEALDALDLPDTDPRRLDNWITAGRMHKIAGDADAAHQCLQAALPLVREAGWSTGIGRALEVRASLLMDDGEFDRAYEASLEAERHLRSTDPLAAHALAEVLSTRGGILYYQAQFDEAVDCFREAADLFARCEEMSKTARCKNSEATMFIAGGDYRRADQTARLALKKAHLLRNPVLEADCLNNLAEIARARREFDEARKLYREASALWRRSGSRDFVTADLNAALSDVGRGEWEPIARRLPDLRRHVERAGIRFYEPVVDLLAAYCSSAQGEWQSWEQQLGRALEATRQMELVDRDLGWLADRVGRRAIDAGELDRGRRALEFAAEQYEAVGDEESAREAREYAGEA